MQATSKALPQIKGRVLILGDSISDFGQYCSFIHCYLALTHNAEITLINAGVSSETCSGLSEPTHPYMRPCVHGRIDRALSLVKPDWVILSYGINDGIYYPYSSDRFAAYTEGMTRLVRKVQNSGAKAVLMTPLCYDITAVEDKPCTQQDEGYSYARPYQDYDAVMQRYAQWIMSDGAVIADAVIDVRTPILADIKHMKSVDAAYKSGDGIHPCLHGHYTMANTVLQSLFAVNTPCLEKILEQDNYTLFNMIYEHDQLEHCYYKELIGHDNPNKSAVPADWQAQAQALETKISAYIATFFDMQML